MERWNLQLPQVLDDWPGTPAFLAELERLGGALVQALYLSPWVTVDLPPDVDPWLLPGILDARPDQPAFLADVDPAESWHTFVTGADQVHSRGYRGEGISLAVLDTGFFPHQEFQEANIATVASVFGDDGSDNHGHGTLVLGMLAAQGVRVMGIAPGATYHVVKVFDPGGFGGSASTIASGIDLATTLQARVLSLSVVVSAPDPMLEEALARFLAQGGLPVVAVGNNGDQANHLPWYPARYPITIGVGAHDAELRVPAWSAWGPWPDYAPDCVAPGAAVTCPYIGPQGTYAVVHGTSMATPAAAGCLALSMAARPDLWAVSGSRTDPRYGTMVPARVARARELLRDLPGPAVDAAPDRRGYGSVSAANLSAPEVVPETPPQEPPVQQVLTPWQLVAALVFGPLYAPLYLVSDLLQRLPQPPWTRQE